MRPRAADEGTCLSGGGRSAPPSLFYKKRRCRLAVPEKNRRGSGCNCPTRSIKSTPDTPAGPSERAPVKAPFTQGRLWLGDSPSLVRRRFWSISGSRGRAVRAPTGVYFLWAAFRRALWGPGAHSCFMQDDRLPCPWRVLSWTAPAARSLFARKENGGLESTPLGGGKKCALRAQN